MNRDGLSSVVSQGGSDKLGLGSDPLRRKVMSALASVVDKHRRVLEEHDQVVITIHLDWRNGKVRETVMGLPVTRHIVSGE